MLSHRTQISDHARFRWEERFQDQDMLAAMRSAMPFGAQRGESRMWLSGDAVFVVVSGVVKTVLTYDMAVANMQSRGMRFLVGS